MIQRSDRKKNQEEAALDHAQSLLRYDASDPPIEPVDDFTRRRLINAAIAIAEKEVIVDEKDKNTRLSRTRLIAGIGLAFGSVAAALLLILFVLKNATDSNSMSAQMDDARIKSIPLQVLMASKSETRLYDEAFNKTPLEAGLDIETKRGYAVLGLSDRARIQVDPQTRLQIIRTDEKVCGLSLKKGSVLASIDPGTILPRFTISTNAGLIRVKGTVFNVAITDTETILKVFRGKVEIEKEGSPVREVLSGNSLSMRTGVLQPIDLGAEEDGLLVARTLDVLDAAEKALLEVDTEPEGADVFLDGEHLGKSPIIMSVRSGYRELEISLDGWKPVYDRLVLYRDVVLSKKYSFTTRTDSSDVSGVSKGSSETGSMENRINTYRDNSLTPADLLFRARALRKDREWFAAARSYEQLLASFPSAPEGRNARVSLGLLQLNQLGKPDLALNSFNEYLSSNIGGALAQEALYGKASALRALGRTDEESVVLEQILARFPNSLRIDEVKQRLSIIKKF